MKTNTIQKQVLERKALWRKLRNAGRLKERLHFEHENHVTRSNVTGS